ncbi:PIG-L family deacetylase [Pelagibacterium mangrovi]|uniref:PIG-L family deacetylase n=1 Tax=Pelagibacterium mangrovi TaxID=3119828 RepID=UPI002FC6FAFA
MSIPRQALSHRFAQRRANPRLVTLARALARLKSTVTVLHTGAHPDDEQNAMLAYMRFGLGMRTIIGCSTRGEGGQNTLGPERGGALGVVRTRELEEAAKVIDADIVWLGFGPSDPVHDFGFSKNGEDTLARWGRDRLLERLVRAYREERPDIVIPTFLDVPGQHGHHRAMTMAARDAIALAADETAYPTHFAQGLTPWRVTKFYLPAWSGGGSTYDDEMPPPPTTVTITLPGPDTATGASFDEIGEWSRIFHASQGMGEWPETPQTEWPLHLALGPADDDDIADNLPRRLAEIAEPLSAADIAIAEAIAAFPHPEDILPPLTRALEIIEAQGQSVPAIHAHRIATLRSDLETAMAVAAGIDCILAADTELLAQGESTELSVTLFGAPSDAKVALHLPQGLSVIAQSAGRYTIEAAPDAPLTDPFGPKDPIRIAVSTTIAGRRLSRSFELERPLAIVPASSVALSPNAILVPADRDFSGIEIACKGSGPAQIANLTTSQAISAANSDDGFSLSGSPLPEGRYDLPVTLDGAPAFSIDVIDYPHIGRTPYLTDARLSILALDLALPTDRRVGYVGGGADNVASWLTKMGFEVTELDASALSEDLSRHPTIVIGLFAFGLRPDLRAKTDVLRAYVEGGGNLVTLYHRPWDEWDAQTVPPRPLTIGQPSLRWRVTDPDASVDILAPNHALFAGPNTITEADFSGWTKERGLYFASQWDDAYIPLLAMSDAGEAPLQGALLSAQIGSGRHTHTSLVLHHQLDNLVPGAFRIMANLVAGGRM